ncbi:hypothetical protein [Actinoplanes awajinensis]|uniref:Uncharacterized protein n=1 Tax=Actinoplanes awajinensis subsp. mycoplanecinus TaxID=135947 RepID=A0A0X3V6V9_9ACTN|nr:hypothetical protein [Actinoplanes awajinensis]KUL40541.1 hypothetical protein ADL15_07110 [Actinoplanes awajinensis subsp. mycoplanecinus]
MSVISTTFASVARLLVDDAGQTTPQLAADAIWRSRRPIAVGDPLPLEPVSLSCPPPQQALRRHRIAKRALRFKEDGAV